MRAEQTEGIAAGTFEEINSEKRKQKQSRKQSRRKAEQTAEQGAGRKQKAESR
jgi:hypothetical protein